MEVWKDITGFEGKYQVSSLGRIKALARVITCKRVQDSVSMAYHKAEKILAGGSDKDGYKFIRLGNKRRRVHQLVAEAFIPNPENKPVVDHINTDPADNRVENLRWVTMTENSNNPLTKQHQRQAHLGKKHSEETRRKISQVQIGRKHTEETKQKMSRTRMGHGTSHDTRQKIKMSQERRPVVCLTTNETFVSYNDAGRKYGLGLWLALKLNKPFKGMVFKYADELS